MFNRGYLKNNKQIKHQQPPSFHVVVGTSKGTTWKAKDVQKTWEQAPNSNGRGFLLLHSTTWNVANPDVF